MILPTIVRSNLNTISKMIERLFLGRLIPHVATTGKFNPLQSAYRKHHSTETALVKILDDLYRIVDRRSAAGNIDRYLLAAFDNIDHEILFRCLRSTFGISGSALVWIE